MRETHGRRCKTRQINTETKGLFICKTKLETPGTGGVTNYTRWTLIEETVLELQYRNCIPLRRAPVSGIQVHITVVSFSIHALQSLENIKGRRRGLFCTLLHDKQLPPVTRTHSLMTRLCSQCCLQIFIIYVEFYRAEYVLMEQWTWLDLLESFTFYLMFSYVY